MSTAKTVEPITGSRGSLVTKVANRYGVDPGKFLDTLKATAFKVKDIVVTNEQMMALLIVADQYGLNPFVKELYAYPDKQNGIVPVVSVDGWTRLINNHPATDGVEFRYADDMVVHATGEHKPCPEWCEVIISRKDRSSPVVIREYFDEVYRPPFKKDGYVKPGPWQTHTKRMLRWKTLIQGGRVAFSYSGIYDEDEAQNIIERDMGMADVVEQTRPKLKDKLRVKAPVEVPPESDPEPHATYAEIADKLNAAQSQDARDEAADLISGIDDEKQKIELYQLFDKLSGEA